MKKEVEDKKEESIHRAKFHPARDDSVIKALLTSGEQVVYHSWNVYLTNKRIIKKNTSWWSRMFHFFYETFEDLDYRYLTSIKARNVINLKLFITGLIIPLLGVIAGILDAIPGLSIISKEILWPLVNDLGVFGLILISLIIIISSLIIRDRVIEFYGSDGSVLRANHFYDEELVKVRELQELRMKNNY